MAAASLSDTSNEGLSEKFQESKNRRQGLTADWGFDCPQDFVDGTKKYGPGNQRRTVILILGFGDALA